MTSQMKWTNILFKLKNSYTRSILKIDEESCITFQIHDELDSGLLVSTTLYKQGEPNNKPLLNYQSFKSNKACK